jgi:hypothetical protein
MHRSGREVPAREPPRNSYGVERLTRYRTLPQMGPPETIIWEYSGEGIRCYGRSRPDVHGHERIAGINAIPLLHA